MSADLDVAMAVRRDGVSGEALPPGVLSRHKGTWFERTISELERDGSEGAVSLGLTMLRMADTTVEKLNSQVGLATRRTAVDGLLHDVTIAERSELPGLTVHCGEDSDEVAAAWLMEHCEYRKYRQRADEWFGMLVDRNGTLRCVAALRSAWSFDPKMEATVDRIARRRVTRVPQRATGKVGRNDPCPCGSGRKYKRCCLNL